MVQKSRLAKLALWIIGFSCLVALIIGGSIPKKSNVAFADDEDYGLFTYEELSEQFDVPEEIFNAVNGQYLKVSIGKGLIALQDIAALVARYAEYF